ncbi:MAG: hypothetical protein IPG72_15100 [Ardenticatenales bacterium]|nr:hypothetical protein [Ardenticatenales bacterium]
MCAAVDRRSGREPVERHTNTHNGDNTASVARAAHGRANATTLLQEVPPVPGLVEVTDLAEGSRT